MRVRRVLQHLVIGVYLFITVEAFLFTFMRIRYLTPYPILKWSYGMMAPYQGDTSWNLDLFAEARLPDGRWIPISVDRYLPHGFGEANVRKFLRIYRAFGPLGHREKFTEYALQLLDRERERGMPYVAVRLSFDRWPRSPEGFQTLRQFPFMEREFITQVQ